MGFPSCSDLKGLSDSWLPACHLRQAPTTAIPAAADNDDAAAPDAAPTKLGGAVVAPEDSDSIQTTNTIPNFLKKVTAMTWHA